MNKKNTFMEIQHLTNNSYNNYIFKTIKLYVFLIKLKLNIKLTKRQNFRIFMLIL